MLWIHTWFRFVNQPPMSSVHFPKLINSINFFPKVGQQCSFFSKVGQQYSFFFLKLVNSVHFPKLIETTKIRYASLLCTASRVLWTLKKMNLSTWKRWIETKPLKTKTEISLKQFIIIVAIINFFLLESWIR